LKSSAAGGGIFEQIRRSCGEVARRARSVRIDDAGLEALAVLLASEEPLTEDYDPAHHFAGDEETTLAFTFLLDAINFGSGWFPVLAKPDGMSGYRTIATACRERFEAEGRPAATELRSTSPEWMAEMLGQNPSVPEVLELMSLFARAWRDFGDWLGVHHGDRFESVIASAAHSAEGLVASLAQMPLYRDVAAYEELEVPFYKRAQITSADLSRVFRGESHGRFDDLDRLTLFADNLVPHVLRCHDVLRYEPGLAERIERGELIQPGSAEEVEIRAVALEAVERLVKALDGLGRPTTAQSLDGLLWNSGQAPEIKARPRHRARSSFY